MKRKSLKKVALLLVIGLISSSFIGCSGTGQTQQQTTAAQTTATATTAAAETSAAAPGKEIVLTMWDGDEEGEWDTFFNNLYAEFTKKYPNIKVKRVNASKGGPNDGEMNVQAALAAGTGPALLTWANIANYAPAGYVAQLDDYMKDWPYAKDLNPFAMKYATVDGKTYALPAQISYITPNCIFYRKDIAQQIGLDITKEPKTWAEFEDWAKKFNDNGFKTLFSLQYIPNFYVGNGGRQEIRNADKTTAFTLNSTECVETFQWLQGLYKRGYVDITETASNQTYIDKFVTGKAGFMIENFGQLGRSLLPSGLTDNEVGIIPYPTKDGQVKATNLSGGVTAINGTMSKEKQDAAWELLKFTIGDKEVFRNIIWPFQKKIDYRPLLITTFKDQQEECFNILGVDTEYAAKMTELIVNPLERVNLPYNEFTAEINGARDAILFKNADAKSTLDTLAEKITKGVVEPYNQKVAEDAFYKDMKNSEDSGT